jgi:anthranilate synthase component 1
MEIIEEAEPTRRGLYGGAVGYFSFKGDADFAIAIRTMLVKAGRAHIQAGAGVVADSDPAREYDECVNKARALLNAVELAHMGLD